MEKLTDYNVADFMKELGSGSPAPGGGSAAALCGTVGVALATMVAGLTIGKEKYKDHWPLMEDILREGNALRQEILSSINEDAEAYSSFRALAKMPKDTAEEKAARHTAMQQALKTSTLVPYIMMEQSLKALTLTQKAMGHSNVNAVSDLGVSALALKAAVQGAWLNVCINLPGLDDRAFAEDYRTKGKALLEQALPLADKIYEEVRDMLVK